MIFEKFPVILDGATGTNLFAAGMPSGVCVEKWVLEHPAMLISLQKSFIEAGADIIYAPTFSANRAKLADFSLENEVSALNAALVALSKKAASGTDTLIAGDLSPTGLFPEPFGDTPTDEIFGIYFEQVSALKDAGADLIICETFMSAYEPRLAALAAKKAGIPVFATVTVDENGRTLSGATPLSALIALQSVGVDAFGLNCSCGPEKMLPILKELLPYASVPLIAKPNAGLPSDEYYVTPEKMGDAAESLVKSGVSIVGGCCGTTPEHLAAISARVKNSGAKPAFKKMPDNIFSNETSVFFLGAEPVFSENILCDENLADNLLGADADVLSVSLNSEADASEFAMNAHLASLPVCFRSENAAALEKALFLYPGRAMVSSASVSADALKGLSEKYGAVIISEKAVN